MFAYPPVAVQPVESRVYGYEALAHHTENNDRVYEEETTSSLHSSIPLYEIASYDAHTPNQNMLILRKYANAVGDYQAYWVWVRWH